MSVAPITQSALTATCPTVDGMSIHRHEAMGTGFELRLGTKDRVQAEQMARAAFELLDRLEGWLSRFRENSDVCRLNRFAGRRPVPVNPRTFRLLKRCVELQHLTHGAFSITAQIGSSRASRLPALEFDPGTRRVFLSDPRSRLDLGAVGKGYALDEMSAVLREWDVDRALLSGGSSSFLAWCQENPGRPWKVRVDGFRDEIELRAGGLGVSGQGTPPHILDPRTGRWIERGRLGWCLASDATTADALSTACLLLDAATLQSVCRQANVTAAVNRVFVESPLPG